MLKWNETLQSVERWLAEILWGIRRQGEIEDNMYRQLNPSHSSSPYMYGTPMGEDMLGRADSGFN